MADDGQQRPLSEIPLLYASALRIGISFADVRLYFGEGVPSTPPAGAETNQPVMAPANQIDRLCVVISPDLIPGIAAGLRAAVEAYENMFGTLRTPPQNVQASKQ